MIIHTKLSIAEVKATKALRVHTCYTISFQDLQRAHNRQSSFNKAAFNIAIPPCCSMGGLEPYFAARYSETGY